MAPNPSGPATPWQRPRGRQPAQSEATPDTPDTKKSLPKRTKPEDITGQAKKAKVEHPIASPMSLVFSSAEPPQIDTSAGANSAEPPQIENAEQPGDNRHLQSDTPAGANSPTPPQPPQSPASARSVVDLLEESQDSQASQSEATDKLDKEKNSHGLHKQMAGRFFKCKLGASGSWTIQFSVSSGASSGSSGDFERSLERLNSKAQKTASVSQAGHRLFNKNSFRRGPAPHKLKKIRVTDE